MIKQEREIWKEPFFTELDLQQKMFFVYVKDHSDEDGIFELNSDEVSERIGFDVDADFVSSFVEVVNKDKPRISESGTMLKLIEPTDPDPVDEFIRTQNETARSGNALKPKS